jgi:AraC-like DNA-binding protein
MSALDLAAPSAAYPVGVPSPVAPPLRWERRRSLGTSAPPVAMIRASSLSPLLRYLARIPGSTASLLGSVQSLVGDGDAPIPLTSCGDLWERAARLCRRGELGLLVGLESPRTEAGDPAPVSCGATIGAAFEAAERRGWRSHPPQRFWLVHRGDETAIHWRYAPVLQRGRRPLNDFALMRTVAYLRRASGVLDWRPLEIRCEGSPPSHLGRLAALALRRVGFGQPDMSLIVPRSLLQLAVPGGLSSPPVLEDAIPESDFVASVRMTVAALLRLGEAVLPVAAAAAGLSVRSFQRRLEAAGIRFCELVQECRFETARRMLRDPSRKIIQISAELGYTDSANFTRAFRRWAGMPPQEYRRRAAGGLRSERES